MQEHTRTVCEGLTLHITHIVNANPRLGLDCRSSEGAIA